MKKILCIVFALLMALSVFLTGCAEKPAVESTKEPDKPVDTSIATVEPATDAETGAPVVDDGLPDVRFDQNGQKREFRVLTSAVSQLDIYTEDHMINQAVHDSVRTRNLNVEERFGVKINVVVEEYQKVTQIVKKLVKSNADDYELCFVHMVNGAALAQNNEVLSFEKLPYVDLSQPWWDKDIKSGFSIRNNIMMVNGDISPTSFNYTSCLYFNKRMFDALDIEYPYKLASEGKWTLDKLIEITKDVSKDMDNDGKITHDSSRDVFGITSSVRFLLRRRRYADQ